MSSDAIFIDNDDRYSRLRLISWWDQDKLAKAKVLVVGAGALGNEVLKNLALLGVGKVYVVDFDEIENSNLTRSVLFRRRDVGKSKAEAAAAMLTDINPDTIAAPMRANIITDVGLGLFRDVNVVIGCLDNREARLWVNRFCWKATTPWVDGGIQEISGVAKVFAPPAGACYECAMTENDYRLINLRYSCPLLSQDDLLAGKVPTAPTISSIVGGLQTQEALKLIHALPAAEGAALVFNGQANQFYRTNFQRKEDCLSHETWPDPIELSLSAESTATELFAAAAERFASEARLRIELERDLVVSLRCEKCATSVRVMRPSQLVGMKQAKCPACGEARRPRMVNQIEAGGEFAAEKLSALGFPRYDVVRVVASGAAAGAGGAAAGAGGGSTGEAEQFFLLGGDRQAVMVS